MLLDVFHTNVTLSNWSILLTPFNYVVIDPAGNMNFIVDLTTLSTED